MTKTITLPDMANAAQERADWLMHSAAHMRERAQQASDAADLELHRTYIRWAESDEHKAACFSALATLARKGRERG